MGEVVDPRNASIDGLIDWLRQKRRLDPASPLADLIGGCKFDQQRLVDIACIDLMQRHRMEHDAGVESYLAEFPCLNTESDRLDLIDAELCVAKELGTTVNLERYLSRFPELADPIRELFELEHGARPAAPAGDSAIVAGNIDQVEIDQVNIDQVEANINATFISTDDDFTVDVPSEVSPQRLAGPLDHPLDIPDWFVVAQCVGSGPGRWLIRGRDSVRGKALALKITELPSHLSPLQAEQILDVCELAARVRNSCWVPPSVAAIQQRHLGVIRPWLFARPWQLCKAAHDPGEQLRQLASVAFAIESAHRIGATHGGIHSENLMVDHTDKVQVLDAGASRIGLQRWLNPANGDAAADQIASLDERVQVDVQDVIKLVASAAVDWQQAWTLDLVADLRRIAHQNRGQACGEIGHELIRCADDVVPTARVDSAESGRHRSWRKRLARWIDGES
jgi:hypothetical protein